MNANEMIANRAIDSFGGKRREYAICLSSDQLVGNLWDGEALPQIFDHLRMTKPTDQLNHQYGNRAGKHIEPRMWREFFPAAFLCGR